MLSAILIFFAWTLTCQCGVKGLRTVRCRQDDDTRIALKAIHFREQLVQGLLPFVVSAVAGTCASLLTDCIDLIDEDDAGCLLLGLLEQVTDLGSAHADEHLHEFRSGHREERYICLTGNRLCQHGLAGSGRADEQHALGHGGTDLLVLGRVLQVGDDLLEIVLCLLLTGHIREADAVARLHVDPGIAPAKASGAAEHHRIVSAHGLHQLAPHPVADKHEQNDGHHPGYQESDKGRGLLHDLRGKLCAGSGEPVHQAVVLLHDAGLVHLRVVLVGKDDLVRLDLDVSDLLVLCHLHECAVVHFLHLGGVVHGNCDKIQNKQNDEGNDVKRQQRPFGFFDFVHTVTSSCNNFSYDYKRKTENFPPLKMKKA